VPLKVVRGRDAADVAIDTLGVHVELPRRVLGDFVSRVCHGEKVSGRRRRVVGRRAASVIDVFRRRLGIGQSLDVPRYTLPVFSRAFLLAMAIVAAASCRESALPVADGRTGDLAAGRRIFESKCASCHNFNGDGRTATGSRFRYANLIDGVWRSDGSAEAIERQIRLGHDPMPRFEGKLTDQEIRQTVAYVQDLARAAESARAAQADRK
jgi:mono/diheme cytochrome c family protein